MSHHSGFPHPAKREKARALLAEGDAGEALRMLGGCCYGVQYDTDYFELLGRALLACGQPENAGRFLFLSGVRRVEYLPSIQAFLSRHSDPKNFRQLQSQLPERVRVLWRLKQFPAAVADELRSMGWPEDTQAAIVARRRSRRDSNSTEA